MPRGCWEKKKKKVQLPKSTCSSAVTFMEKKLLVKLVFWWLLEAIGDERLHTMCLHTVTAGIS